MTKNYGMARDTTPRLDGTKHVELQSDPAAYNRVLSGMRPRSRSWRGHDRLPMLDTRACALRPKGEG